MWTSGASIGRFRIERPLSSGGMGCVLLATDTTLDRLVALKLLPEQLTRDPVSRQRLLDEAKAASKLNHPNILTIYSEEMVDGQDLIVMEYVPGEPLAEVLAQGALDIGLATGIAEQVAAGLAAAHRANLIHRDIKPSNILIFPDGRVKIADFGLATSRADVVAEQPPTFSGTIAYSSPEQIQGLSVDHRSDIWALGIVFYQMLTGCHPFADEHDTAIAYAIVHEDPVPPKQLRADLPEALQQIVLRCLSRSQEVRFQSADELLEVLRRARAALQAPPPLPASHSEEPPSIAVVPFANLSAEREQAYFCEGIAEEIINALAKVKKLRVAARGAAFASRRRYRDPREIGRHLNVRTILEGSVRKSGSQLRVSAQLIDVKTGYNLWAERYDRAITDVFAIQDEIAESIVRALRVILSEEERRALTYVSTGSIHAYDCYLRGRQYFHQARRKSLEYAREMFLRAIAMDPSYARAYAAAADCSSLLVHFYGDSTESNLNQADLYSQRALELDGQLAEGHAARSFALWVMRRHDEAEHEFEEAVRLDSKLYEAYYYFGRGCVEHGDLARAAALFEEACRVQDHFEPRYFAAQTYSALGQLDKAEQSYRRSLALLEKHMELNSDDARAVTIGAVCHCRLGDQESGVRWAERAVKIDPDDAGIRYNVACLFALAGRKDRAIDCLEFAVHAGFATRAWVEKDPDLDSLRDDPRFQAMPWRA
jgi:serine/threonine protein kinase/Tfp pilus assembly protein PilF